MITLSEIESAQACIDCYNELVRQLEHINVSKGNEVRFSFNGATIIIPNDHIDWARVALRELLTKQIADTRAALAEFGIKAD